ncbi:MAG: hypothetical protein QME52_01625 [Bacteroidota bacterium]|nr:hypothetical protein [Bacteroidota bacterium]
MYKKRTIGEKLFERYLISQGLADFDFEKTFKHTTTKLDYSVIIKRKEFLFEVKDFNYTKLASPHGCYDPYNRIRNHIHKAKGKFQDFKQWPCALVLYNNNAPLVHLTMPHVVAGAMYGDVGISWYVNLKTGKSIPKSEHMAFLSKGKMGTPAKPFNTTISALITLRKVFDRDGSLKGLGVIVWENRFARIRFPKKLFRGPFDERYAFSNGQYKKIFGNTFK